MNDRMLMNGARPSTGQNKNSHSICFDIVCPDVIGACNVELFIFGFPGNKSLMKVTDENLVERVKQVVCLSVCLDMFKNSVRIPH